MAFKAYGEELIYERHRHRYEVNNAFRDRLAEAGLVISGVSPDGRLVEMIELPDHPWFVASQGHPEFKSRPTRPHPCSATSSPRHWIIASNPAGSGVRTKPVEGLHNVVVAKRPPYRAAFSRAGVYKDGPIGKEALVDESIDTDDLIDLAAEYIAYLRIERGSSPRTIEAYEADLKPTGISCLRRASRKLSQVSRESIVAYQEHLFAQGLRRLDGVPKSVGGEGLSPVLRGRGLHRKQPCGRAPLPKTRSACPTFCLSTRCNAYSKSLRGRRAVPRQRRNRAMLEVLYGCGLRVSEPVRPRPVRRDARPGYLLVLGKGGKQRISPISGAAAMRWPTTWRAHARSCASLLRKTHRCRVLEQLAAAA